MALDVFIASKFVGLLHLLFGLALLIFPRILRYLIGGYFVLIGVLVLFL